LPFDDDDGKRNGPTLCTEDLTQVEEEEVAQEE